MPGGEDGNSPVTSAPEKNRKPSEPSRKYQVVSFGYTFAAGMVVFTMIGYYIDKKVSGDGGWTLAGMFLGLGYGGYELCKLVRQISSQDAEENEEEF